MGITRGQKPSIERTYLEETRLTGSCTRAGKRAENTYIARYVNKLNAHRLKVLFPIFRSTLLTYR